jgi:hypothetical protein
MGEVFLPVRVSALPTRARLDLQLLRLIRPAVGSDPPSPWESCKRRLTVRVKSCILYGLLQKHHDGSRSGTTLIGFAARKDGSKLAALSPMTPTRSVRPNLIGTDRFRARVAGSTGAGDGATLLPAMAHGHCGCTRRTRAKRRAANETDQHRAGATLH